MAADSGSSPAAGHVLLVDDDEGVRSTLSLVLRRAGYEVTEAANGLEAFDAFEERCPDLLLSDLVMPPPNGQQLAMLCRDHCPDTALIFMSGYSEEELHELRIKQVVFLPKPIQADPLLRTIARLLE